MVVGSEHKTNHYGASVTKFTTGRQAVVLPSQLGEADTESVGSERCEQIRNTLHATALPNTLSAAPKGHTKGQWM